MDRICRTVRRMSEGGTGRHRAVCLPEREPWEPTLTGLRPVPKSHYPVTVWLCEAR
jgi:hypothetical protein